MYKIKVGEVFIQNTEKVVINPRLKEAVNRVPTFDFSVDYEDKNEWSALSTVAEIYEHNDNLAFKGRLIEKKKNFDGSKWLNFEGELAYLNDILFPPFEYSGSVEGFFRLILDYYNENCSSGKTINVGTITVTDSNDYIVRSSENYNSCFSVIQEKMVKMLGGYINLRYTNGNRYLDYLVDFDSVSTQGIEFGKNLLNLEEYVDMMNIATVIIPLGAKDDETKKRVDITSVNEGSNKIVSEMANEYGCIEKVVIWDDVTEPHNLLTKANNYLSQMILSDVQITANAIDLGFTSETIESFQIGMKIPCISIPHGIDTTMVLSERERNLNDPTSDSITLGSKNQTLTSSIVSNEIKTNETDSKLSGNFIQNIIKNQTETMFGKGGNIIDVYDENGHRTDIMAINGDTVESSTEILRMNKNGIAFSRNGINGPYITAWTIDGGFNADFIASGSITASLIRGGILRLGSSDMGDGKMAIYNEQNELISTIDSQGIRIFNDTDGSTVIMNNKMFGGTDANNEMTFEASGDRFVMKKAEIKTQIDIANQVRFLHMKNGENTGVAVVSIV